MEHLQTDTVVLGLGAMGSAALYHLALRGIPAIGIERFALGHARGSTHGPSRVFRLFYPQTMYIDMGLAAQQQWQDLETLTGHRLLTLCGQVVLARPDNTLFQQGLAALAAMAVPHTPLSHTEIRTRFPALYPPADRIGCWVPQAGILAPQAALKALIAVARETGAQILEAQTVQGLDHGQGQFNITLADQHIRCQRLICTAGAWTADLLPDLAPHLRITRQQKFQFHSLDTADLHPDRVPVYVDYEAAYYGFPVWEGVINVADDGLGCPVQPHDVDRTADPVTLARLTAWINRLLPGHAWQHIRTETCLYTNTPDADFVLDHHPTWPGMVIGAGFSGHGFKFTPLIGQLLVQLALEEEPSIDINALRLHSDRLQSWTEYASNTPEPVH